MQPWPAIPDDVVAWFRAAFAEANRQATERLLNVPNIREVSLDDGLVEALIPHSPPRLLPSGTVVQMHIHNIGGLRRLGRWETADIAVLVFVYRGAQLTDQKIGLLQSKRLFPLNRDVADDDPVGFLYGMNSFLSPGATSPLYALNARYVFNKRCKYGSLNAGHDQIAAIEEVNRRLGDCVYYLFYNPPSLPCSVRYPVVSRQVISEPPLGCRVYGAAEVHRLLDKLKPGRTPTFSEVQLAGAASDWRLETWAADLLLRCKVGQRFTTDADELIRGLLMRRTGPIGAVVAASIALPPE